jgi:uncharacterized delta-60 repeat protein
MRNSISYWNGSSGGKHREAKDPGRPFPSKAATLTLAVTCLLSPQRAEAQAGGLDMNFAPRIASPADTLNAVVLQPDGKLLVFGFFGIVDSTTVNPDPVLTIARLNPDGKLDPSFKSATWGTPTLQADGKIVLNASQSIIVRLQPDGSLDPTLNLNSYVFTNQDLGVYYTVASQPDGKVIVGGIFSDLNRQRYRYLARANSDGTLDTSFAPAIGPDLGPANYVNAAALQPDGKILVGGRFTLVGWEVRHQMARLNNDGSLDSSFDPEGGPDTPPSIIVALPNGKVLIAGDFSSFNAVHRAGLARLNGNGSLDETFDPGSGIGGVTNEFGLRAVAVQPDGRVIVGGRFTGFEGATGISGIVRLNPDGGFDRTFNTGSGVSGSNWRGEVDSIEVQPDNKIVIAGGFSSFNEIPRRGIARLGPDGSLDEGFNPDLEIPSGVAAIAVQSDGRPVIALPSVLVNGAPRSGVARLNQDGSLDQSFDSGGSVDVVPSFIVAKPDGKLLIGHYLTGEHGLSGQRIARLNADGSEDNSFRADTNTFILLSALLSQPDDRVLVAGLFKGVPESGIIRLDEDGSLDRAFIGGLRTAGTVSSVALQSDGKILVGGSFSNFSGFRRTNLARLNVDGVFDSSFIASGITNISQKVESITEEPGGKILLVIADVRAKGEKWGSSGNNHLVRLNQDGSTDNGFASPLMSINSVAIGRDGKIYAAGISNKPVGYFLRNMFRLNPDGSVDAGFRPVTFGANSNTYGGNLGSIALEPDGLSILVTGEFSSVNGVLRTSLARVFAVAEPTFGISVSSTAKVPELVLSGETGHTYRIEASANLEDWLPLYSVSLTRSPRTLDDLGNFGFGHRFYRAVVVPPSQDTPGPGLLSTPPSGFTLP